MRDRPRLKFPSFRLLLDADRALYLAKERGRNRIVLAERRVVASFF